MIYKDNSITRYKDKMIQKWKDKPIPEDIYDCLVCGETYRWPPFSGFPVYDEKQNTFFVEGSICKNCWILVDQFIQQKQRDYELR